jgi:hypothetical protein
MNPPPPRAAADALDSSRKALLRLIPLSLAYFGGHVSGAIWTYVLLVLTGHAPTWFGPELRDVRYVRGVRADCEGEPVVGLVLERGRAQGHRRAGQ